MAVLPRPRHRSRLGWGGCSAAVAVMWPVAMRQAEVVADGRARVACDGQRMQHEAQAQEAHEEARNAHSKSDRVRLYREKS